MKFKLDENLPRELVEDLANLGHETDTVFSEGLTGAGDAMVVQAAQTSGRILMTLDKGIASLLQYPIHEHGGTVLFRPDESGPIGSILCALTPSQPDGVRAYGTIDRCRSYPHPHPLTVTGG